MWMSQVKWKCERENFNPFFRLFSAATSLYLDKYYFLACLRGEKSRKMNSNRLGCLSRVVKSWHDLPYEYKIFFHWLNKKIHFKKPFKRFNVKWFVWVENFASMWHRRLWVGENFLWSSKEWNVPHVRHHLLRALAAMCCESN